MVTSLNAPASSASSITTDWFQHLNNWKVSGLSQAEYCRRHNLNYCVFHYWKKKQRATSSPIISSSTEPKFVEVKGGISQSPSPVKPKSHQSGGLRFWYGDICIEVDRDFSPLTLLELIRALQEL